MRAKIEVEVIDDTLDDIDLRTVIIEQLFNLCHGWVAGDHIPKIDFIYTDDEHKLDLTKIHWNNNDNDLVN
jgi:hypothetical protein